MLGKLDSWSLNIPVTLPPCPHGTRNTDNTTVIEETFSQSTPSTITSWENQDLFGLSEGRSDIPSAHGVAVGCKDGSLFILRSASHSASLQPNIALSIPSTPSPPEPTSPPTSPRRYRGLGHPSSRSASPSSLKAISPFQLSRSRVVSAVSTESAEAPKNYVDFDDERERMRGMLKGRKSRERHASTSRTRQEKDSSASSQSTSAQISSLRKEDTRNYLSAALSPSSSTLSLSNPPSPTFPPAASPEPNGTLALNLRCHVYPPYARPGSSVSALKMHEGDRYISCLHESGGLSVHTTVDGSCIVSTLVEAKTKPASAGKAQATPSVLWVWRNLLVAASEESILLLACASPDELYPNNQFLDASSGDSENQTLIIAYELCLGADAVAGEAKLEQLGQWTVSGPLNSIGLRAEHDHSLTFFHTGPGGHLVSRSLTVHDPPPEPADLPGSHSSNHLPLPNPFKALKALSMENIPDTETSTGYERIQLEDPIGHGDLGLTEPLLGLRAHDNGADVRLCAWSARELSICKWTQGTLEALPVVPVSGVRDVRWIDHDSISLLSEDRLAVYAVPSSSTGDKPEEAQPKPTQTIPLSPYDVATLVPGGHAVSTRVKNGRRRIHHTSLALPDSPIEKAKTRALWKARTDAFAAQSTPRISSTLPLELDLIVLGYTDGRICRTTLTEAAQNSDASAQWSDFALPGAILALDVVQNHRTGERVLVGGADDGTIAIWALDTLKLCARWTVFTTPLVRVISLEDEGVGRLHGCVLCISQDGTIAVIAVDGYQFVYLVPASAAPLRRVCLGENNLLLVYTDGRARLWDTGTREFWRSMSVEKAEELLLQGGWHEWFIDRASDKKQALASLGYSSPDAASTVSLDVPALLRQLSPSPALSAASFSPKKKLDHARALLSILLTFGISEGIDTICNEGLAIKPSSASLGLSSPETLTIVPQHNPSSVWMVSPEASADRALAILALLQFLAQFEDPAQDASTVTTFYAASIGQLVPDHQHPSLPRLAHYMLHIQSAEVRQAVRLLLDAGVARLADSETTELVEAWQQYLPVMRTDKEKDSPQSAKALCICGFIAVDKYTLLPTSTLTDIAKSIALFLHDETSPHRSLAIDLCSRGFQVWQQYVDAVEMLRALFTLATTTKKETIAVPNIGVQARSAVLQIAAGNTPLFMTTLAIDILQPRSVQHRKSVMQLVIFLIRKKPLVLYSNLPRLVEAIVKSLDPNSSASRDAVLDSATEILSHIVQTFPTVDFHMATQRLAVGTSEGAVVMYDLKTATRLYVLEGHKKRTTACSFSPDGRRLVTMSLEESDVLVWKVGSSFTSIFMPGAPPRQGHGGSEPFKRLEFHIGEAAHMGIEATLANVQFEWTADRSVRLKIRDSILTFST